MASAAVIIHEATAAAITPQALLPDLAPWVSESRGFVYGWTIQGSELRLTTAMANIGTGRMELRGGAVIGNTQEVNQRVYEPNSSFTDVLAGTFTYHPEHGHIHFDGFAEYRLREVLPNNEVGAILSTGEKISFCLLDVERYDASGPASPFYLTCGQVQGISPGWADVYDRGLDGQSINIANIADGTYWLEVVVDPDNHLIESNETNNVERIQIVLQRGGSTPADAFEPNDSFAAASILAPPEDHTYDALSIHASGNDDYYRVTASATGTLRVSLAFQHAQGDIDLEVYNASFTRLGVSDSVQNAEQLSVNAIAGQFFYIRVYGYNGAVNPNYTLTIDQADGSGIPGDIFEDNDIFAAARSLPSLNQTYVGLSIDTPFDNDFYSVSPAISGTLTVNLAFLHSQGDIDLELLGAAQARLGLSESTDNAEQLSIPVTAGQTYFIRVFGFNGAINPNYSMTISAPAPSPGDVLEENDTFAAARGLVASDQTYTNLSIEVPNDDDYYSLVPTATGTLNVSLAFLNSQGDINLQLFDAAQQLLASSASTADGELLSIAVTAGQTYYIRVFGAGGAVNPNYSMTIDPPEPIVFPSDALEENDTFAAARSLAAADQTYTNLTIDAPNDDDYYSLVPTATGSLNVSLAFLNSQGDINLQLYDVAQQLLASSATAGDAEQVALPVNAGQLYFVRVFGAGGAINPNYSLTIDHPEIPPGDVFENNDTFATARSLPASNQTYNGLSIDAPNDNDYYSLVPTISGTLTVSLAFLHAQGDIDLELLSATQTRLRLSESTGNAEQASVPVTAGQTYVIRVFGFDGAVNPTYTMTIGIVAPPPSTDYYFSLASNGTLTSTNGSPALAFTDADILKLTVLANGQYGYQLHFDGSDVGLTTSNEDIDAFELLADGSILVSTVGSFSVPAPSGPAITGSGEDLLRFVPTTLGATTAGQWSFYFDGSDVGLSGSAENIDAVQRLSDGRLLISTMGNVSVTGASGADEDLVAFTPTTLGTTTAGSWSLYFDGSDVGLTNNDNEDIRALYVQESSGNSTLFFSTLGNFSVTGVSGANEDVFAFNPTSLGSTTAGTFGPGLALRGNSYGLASFAVDGIHFGALPNAGQGAALSGGTANPVASSIAAAATSYRPRPSGSLSTLSNASIRVELVSDALAAALKSSATTTSSTKGVDCGCHAPPATSTAVRRSRPVTSGNFTIWDVLGDMPHEVLMGTFS
jgi:hypothetical protein